MTIDVEGSKRRLMTIACLGFLMISGAGCSAEPTPVQTSATPTSAPVFASDEEALAAATDAYAGYIETADQIITDGGAHPERIEQFATDELAKAEIESYREFESQGLHGTGLSTFSNLSIQSHSRGEKAVVTAYVCSDVSGTDIVDSNGRSTLASTRQTRVPFLIVFDLADPGSTQLKVASADVWKGEGVCE
jgi:hypothetical protein